MMETNGNPKPMHIISRKRLLQFAENHADSETALDTWYRTTKTADWQNLIKLREVYPSADPVGIYLGTTSGEIWGSANEGESFACIGRHLPHIYSVTVG